MLLSYFNACLINSHIDKVAHHERYDAHSKFQEIAFAYAILSDDRRRKRYDTTGNTAETLDIEDDDFNWLDFFRAQWADTVTWDKINDFAGKYKGSDEERQDVLSAFRRCKGNMTKLFREVMLCNVLDDEERFRTILDGAIADGEVEAYDAYVNEPEKKRQVRRKQAEKDAREAEKHAKDMGLNGHKKERKEKGTSGEDDLAAMIQQRQKGRAANFLDDLEAKYAAPKAKKGRKRPSEEPPEEAFQKMGAKAKKQKKKTIVEEDNEDDTDDVDLEADEFDDDDDDDNDLDDEEDEEDGDVKPSTTTKKSKKAPIKKNKTRKKG